MKPLILIGDGGHAEVLIETARLLGRRILGVTSTEEPAGKEICGVRILGDDDVVTKHSLNEVELVNGIGSVDIPRHRSVVFSRFKKLGYTFATVVHPTAIISSNVHLEEGVQLAAGAIVQTGCHVGMNTIINTGSILDHHCQVDAHSHLAPGVVCSGGVRIGERSHIGASSTVIQEIRIGDDVLVAAGAVVTKDLPNGIRVKGIPAAPF